MATSAPKQQQQEPKKAQQQPQGLPPPKSAIIPASEEEKKKKVEKPKEVGRGVVKKVSSGDKLVVYVEPKGKAPAQFPPAELEIKLSGIKAPLPYAKWEQNEREEEVSTKLQQLDPSLFTL